MATKAAKKAVKKPASASAGAPARDVCFVIMPFGGWLDDYYETIYRPAIEAAGLEPHRADDLYRPSTIVNDIWAYTRQARLLVGDLTGKNPNVFYELGLAHALGKPVILVAESMDDIPFDLRALRVIVYDKNHPRWGEQLEAKVEAAIQEVLKAPQEAVLPAFLHVREANKAVTVTPQERELVAIRQDIELLRREVRRRSPETDQLSLEPIGPREARSLIESYLTREMPADLIVERLQRLGVPPSWTRDELQKRMVEAPASGAS